MKTIPTVIQTTVDKCVVRMRSAITCIALSNDRNNNGNKETLWGKPTPSREQNNKIVFLVLIGVHFLEIAVENQSRLSGGLDARPKHLQPCK